MARRPETKKKYVVTLTERERRALRALSSSGKGAARRLSHARIVLKADNSAGGPGWMDAAIRAGVDVGTATVERVRKRFVEDGLEAALTPRPAGKPATTTSTTATAWPICS